VIRRARWAVILLGAILSASSGNAVAFNFFELEAYPAATARQGEQAIEDLTTFVGNGRAEGQEREGDEITHRLVRTTLGYNYGLTDRLEVGARLDLIKPNGGEVEYAGTRLRARGVLADGHRLPVDLGWYVEAEVPHGEATEFELASRLILSRRFGAYSIRVNPIFQLPLVTSERRTIEFSYAAGLYRRLPDHLYTGVEFFGGLGEVRAIDPSREQEHYVFPVLGGRLSRRLRFSIGPGFGITRGSDPIVMKFAIEYGLLVPRRVAVSRTGPVPQ
jgi:hypothetical protein